MKCECIENTEKRLVENLDVWHGKKIQKAECLSAGIIFPQDEKEKKPYLVTNSEFELTLEGQNKKVTISINHNFCPFCGKKIKDDETGGVG